MACVSCSVFFVLIPGIIIAYVSLYAVFPYFDKRVPDAIAILLTYIVGAYVLIPALIRFFRILVPPKHLPLYCVTPDGFASDPLNIGLVGTRHQLILAMEAAGWHFADRHSLRNLFRHGFSLLFNHPYPSAPVSNLYLFGRKQDLAFEIPLAGNPRQRHHVRFWATTFEPGQALGFHTIHWHRRRQHVQGDNLLWVGAASLDAGLGLIRHNAQLSHTVHPDTNSERQLIIDSLSQANKIGKAQLIKLGNPYRLVNRVWLAYFHSDGKMAIAKLR